MSDTDDVAAVRYTFSVHSSVEEDWRVRGLHVVEALSEPYHAVLEVMSVDPAIDLAQLMGQPASLQMIRGEVVHRLSGIVLRIELLGAQANGHVFAQVEVVPAFFLLGQQATSRIFQNKSTPEILREVLKEGLGPYLREVRLDLQGTYPEREYCLQHEETDRDFVERLMQEEGIWYAFEQDGDKELLVLHDKNPTFASVTDEPLRLAQSVSQNFSAEGLRSFAFAHEVRTNTVEIRGFDWTRPDLTIKGLAKSTTQIVPKREVYWHGSEALTGAYDDGGKKYGDTTVSPRARMRAQAEEARVLVTHGRGHVVSFAAGSMFELVDHAVSSVDGKYLVTRVEHLAEVPASHNQTEASMQLEPGYANHFTCLPHGTPFRPARTLARPRIGGLQSAIVTGPSGQEIHTDAHGRIKVRFPWDRKAPTDDTSSCWVRVAQSWGGTGWGTVFIPRVGMEVLVAFFDGDPDRPIVIGSTYNGTHVPPWELPKHKTQSGIATASTPGSDGNNMLRFEDAAGNEELYVQAQKDLNILVKNDKGQQVDGNETLVVAKNRDRTVKGDQILTVQGHDETTVNKTQSVKVDQDQETVVLKNRTVSVLLSQATDIGVSATLNVGAEHLVSVGARQDLSVGASQTINIARDQSTTIGGGMDLSVDKQTHLTVGGELKADVTKDIVVSGHAKALYAAEKDLAVTGERITLTAKSEMVLKVGDASITLKKNGDITIKGNKINVKGDGDVKIKGSKVGGN